jgi:hypothetical protein
MKSVQQRLSALREAMKKHGVDAFVIPSADPHLSEYLPEHWQARRRFFRVSRVRPPFGW